MQSRKLKQANFDSEMWKVNASVLRKYEVEQLNILKKNEASSTPSCCFFGCSVAKEKTKRINNIAVLDNLLSANSAKELLEKAQENQDNAQIKSSNIQELHLNILNDKALASKKSAKRK